MSPTLFLILGIVFLLVFLIALIGPHNTLSSFQKWHIVTRIAAYFGDPERLSKTADNIVLIKEINAKAKNKSTPRLAEELKEAEDNYNEALRNSGGSKANKRRLKQKYEDECAQIMDKYR
jgi:hypothetical protein